MKNLKIHDVWFDDVDGDDYGKGVVVGVVLNNGQSVIIRLDSKADEPFFSDIVKGRCDTKPQTDGNHVYWSNGASLTMDEIMVMLRADGSENAGVGK